MTDQAQSVPRGFLSGRETLTAAMKHLGCVLWCADINGQIVEVGDGAEELLVPSGLGRLLKAPVAFLDVIDPERAEDFRLAFAAYATGATATLDMTCLLRGDGDVYSFWRVASLRRKTRKGAQYVYGILQPVQGDGPLRPVLDLIPHMIFMKDSLGRLLLANQATVENFGRPLERVVGRPLTELQPNVAEAERMLSEDQIALTKNALHVVPAQSFTDASGTERVVQTTTLPYRPASQDGPVVLSVAVDITERTRIERQLRESEERFRLLSDNVPGVIYLCVNDDRYTMTYLNDAVETLTGYPKEEFLRDRISFVDLYHPQDAERVIEEVDGALQAGRSFELEYQLRHADGEYRWVREIGVGVYRENKLVFLEGFLLDITPQKRTIEALEAAHAQLAARVEHREAELQDTTQKLHRRTTQRNLVEASLNSQRASDQRFHDLLKALNEIGHALSEAQTHHEIARIAVERGLSDLHVGRMSIWLRDFDAPDFTIIGTYGTDEHGNLRDERDARLTVGATSPVGVVLRREMTKWYDADVPVFNHKHEIVGRGDRLVAALWDGERVIGTLATDSLTLGRSYTERMMEIVQLYGTTIAHHIARVRNTKALQESAVKLNRIITAMPGAVYQFQRDGNGKMGFTYMSETIKDLCDVPAGEFINNVSKAVETILPEYREPFLISVEKSASTLQPWSMDYQVRTPSGRIRWLRGSSIPEPPKADGTIVWNGVITDITDRKADELRLKENEDRHRSLFAALGEGIIVMNPDGTVREANLAAEKMFGMVRDEMSARGNDEAVLTIRDESGRDLPAKRWPSVHTLQTGEPVSNAVVQIISPERPDGIWVSINTQPMLREGEDKPYAVVASIRDITEQRIIEEERRQLEAELQQAQRIETVGELAGGIAHDFNNLLSAIFSYTETAKRHLADNPDAYHAISQVEKVAHEARTITASLLTFCRKNTPSREAVNIREAVADSIRMVDHMRQHKVTIEAALDQVGALHVFADPTQIRQVMINLMINAIDAMPGGGKLTIEASPRRENEHLLIDLKFTDTGAGITQGDVKRIFEPFFTTRPRGKGTGLGLAIVHGIVKSLSGTIEVHTKLRRGTVMTVSLPAFELTAQESKRQESPTPSSGRIAVVADEGFVRNMMRSWLRREGYDTIEFALDSSTASNGDIDWQTVRAIVIDAGNRIDTCVAHCRELQLRYPSVPIVAMADGDAVNILGKHAGLHVLRKPYRMAEFIDSVHRATLSGNGGTS